MGGPHGLRTSSRGILGVETLISMPYSGTQFFYWIEEPPTWLRNGQGRLSGQDDSPEIILEMAQSEGVWHRCTRCCRSTNMCDCRHMRQNENVEEVTVGNVGIGSVRAEGRYGLFPGGNEEETGDLGRNKTRGMRKGTHKILR
jgi:hypothetical protein